MVKFFGAVHGGTSHIHLRSARSRTLCGVRRGGGEGVEGMEGKEGMEVG